MATLGREDREVDDLRRGRRDGGQDRVHVGLVLVDGLLGRDRATELRELVREDLLERLGVGGAVVDGRSLGQAQLVVRELGDREALERVAVRGAQERRVRRVASRVGQRRAACSTARSSSGRRW